MAAEEALVRFLVELAVDDEFRKKFKGKSRAKMLKDSGVSDESAALILKRDLEGLKKAIENQQIFFPLTDAMDLLKKGLKHEAKRRQATKKARK